MSADSDQPSVLSNSLSRRGVHISTLYKSKFKSYEIYHRDKYHKVLNTSGFLNLSISENRLCTDLITERLCQSDMNYIEDVILQYPNSTGHPFLQAAVAQFLTCYCRAPHCLSVKNVVILNGCCAVFSALATVLCDPGDCFLVPVPFHYGFMFGSKFFAYIELIPVYLEKQTVLQFINADTQPLELNVRKLEQALHEARTRRKKVKGLLLTNPEKPTGDIYPKELLKEYLEFAKRHELHVVVDEIYMLSVFDESARFHSVLSLESLPDPNKTHVIWSPTKDFGISGLCFGVLYTQNEDVVSAMSPFGYLHSVSGITQYKLCRLLQDRDWINKVYLPTNRSRLWDAHAYVTEQLRQLEQQYNFKIIFHNRCSGLYMWINLKKLLEPCTFKEELLLHRRFRNHKLILCRGRSYMFKKPGWFRLTFAENPPQLKEAMHRFGKAIEEQKQHWIEKMLKDAIEAEPGDPTVPRRAWDQMSTSTEKVDPARNSAS
ncbi:probable inactive 1-aminocyclopropane-1-carboxylate synthase-like protein 2 isoform X1 [Cavia porcellus]|uniref:probable inactive 1-aminocyclopropane-1-carboxylate synthase-like protein 2 isoform X1 n=2 Tax=Cavia porcellus TaxID=10141 RepID=UPI002FE32AEA